MFLLQLSVLFLVPPLILFLGNSPDIKGEKHLKHVKYIMSGAAPIADTDMVKIQEKIPAENNCVVTQGKL
jgi:hypothetical protein